MNVRDIIIGKCALCGGWVHAGALRHQTWFGHYIDPPPTCCRCGATALPLVQMNERRKEKR